MFRYKPLSILLVAITILTLGAGIASAQEPPRQGARLGAQALIAALVDLTGLNRQELLAGATSETTLADVAAAHEIDSADVVAQAVTNLTERINQTVENGRLTQERADEILATLEADLTASMNQPLPPRPLLRSVQQIRQRGERILIDALTEATGLDVPALLAQAREQNLTTMAAIAEANGVASEDVIAAAVTAATEQVNQAVAGGNLTQEQADQVLSRLEEAFTNAMNHPIPPRLVGQPGPAGDLSRIVVQKVAEVTGLEPEAVLQQMREGSSLADILAAQGVDANEVVSAVMGGLTERVEQRVWDILNATREPSSPQTE
jgi:urease accessory protein UreF